MKQIRFASFIIVALVSFSFASTSYAARSSYWDLRLSIGNYAAADKLEYKEKNGDSGSESLDSSGMSFEFDVSHRFASSSQHSGYIDFGPTLYRSNDCKIEDGGSKVKLNMYGMNFGGGYSFWLNDLYSLEVGPRGGLGYVLPDWKDLDGDVTVTPGMYLSYELGVRNMFNLTKNFQLGVGLGYAGMATYGASVKREIAKKTYEIDTDFSGSGFFINGFAGFRF